MRQGQVERQLRLWPGFYVTREELKKTGLTVLLSLNILLGNNFMLYGDSSGMNQVYWVIGVGPRPGKSATSGPGDWWTGEALNRWTGEPVDRWIGGLVKH